MGTTTIRFNDEEGKILDELSRHFGMKQSTIIKKALFELYEDIKDIEALNKFEEQEKNGEVKWLSTDEFKKGLDNIYSKGD